jgi:hypothetical protein
MTKKQSGLGWQRRILLSRAAVDFFHLQNRRYPRRSALEWTGNRYALSHMERDLLRRGVFGQEEALRRRSKQCKGADWQKEFLVVDGHNVHITIESALSGKVLLRANDGAVRDLAGQSARFRLSELSERVVDVVFRFLGAFRPREVLFLFDAPMSRSALLAMRYEQRLRRSGLLGEARIAPVPEREFPYAECVVASSDREVLEKSNRWLDLARWTMEAEDRLQLTADFTNLVLVKTRDPYFHLGP